MNKNINIIIGAIVLVVILGGAFILLDGNSGEMVINEEMEMKTIEEQEVTEEKPMTKESDAIKKAGTYEAYAPEKVALASASHNVVLFFRAPWCPTCRAVDADIKANLTKIPSSLTILDVDYDSGTALKQKYGVTYQHTFVQVDAQGNMIKKWQGSPTLSALVSEIK